MGNRRTAFLHVTLLLAVYSVLHALIIQVPNFPLFDEVYYVNAAKAVLGYGGELRPEHPPLGQLMITAGVASFGDSPVGWRFFSVLFGALMLVAVYLLALRTTGRETVALAVGLVLTFDSLFFTFSFLGVLDVFFLLFLASAFYFLTRRNVAVAALMFSLSMVSKLTAIFFFPAFVAFFVIMRLTGPTPWTSSRWVFSRLLLWFSVFILGLTVFLYIFDQLYAGFGLPGAAFSPLLQVTSDRIHYVDPLSHLRFMVATHASPNWPTVAEPPPWMWLFFSQSYYLGGLSAGKVSFLEGFNPAILGLAFLSVPVAVHRVIRGGDELSLVGFLWFAFGYLPWIPFYFLFARPIFHFYILSIVPAVAALNVLLFRDSKAMLWAYVIFNAVFFMLFQYPVRALTA